MPESWRTERRRVLVIADDQGTGELLARLLDRAGWTTDLAFSAASGLSELEDTAPPYVAVVVDLVATAQGLDVLRAVRRSTAAATAELRVLVCARTSGEEGEAWITGADAYLVHPFGGDAFVDAVAAVVERPDEAREEHRQLQVALSIPDTPG